MKKQLSLLKVDGMSCGHCQRAVQKALENIDGVDSVQVDLVQGQATVIGKCDFEALKHAVESEGYDVALVSTSDA